MKEAPHWDGQNWVAEVAVAAWCAESVKVIFYPLTGKIDRPPTPLMLETLARFQAHQHELRPRVDKAMRDYYDEILPQFVDYLEEMGIPADLMPSPLQAFTNFIRSSFTPRSEMDWVTWECPSRPTGTSNMVWACCCTTT